MDAFLQEFSLKLIVSLATGIIFMAATNTIGFFIAVGRRMKHMDKNVRKMQQRLDEIYGWTNDMNTRISNPDHWGLGQSEAVEILKEMSTKIDELNKNMIRLLTIVERNGLRVR